MVLHIPAGPSKTENLFPAGRPPEEILANFVSWIMYGLRIDGAWIICGLCIYYV